MANHNTTFRSHSKILKLDELHLSKEVNDSLNQLIEEFTYIEALRKFNVSVDHKILLHGHTGCGKTATANAIGVALNKKVITLNLGGFVSSRLGETGKNITEVFRDASYENAILFIDEFDFIGKIRDYDEKDSGEMKRLVNTLIQQIDNLANTAILICATNHIGIIDTALLRRFQIKLKYELPTDQELNVYYDSVIGSFPEEINSVKRTFGISYAEAKDVVNQQVKANIIQLEKQKPHLLFVYDSLQQIDVQLQTYGKDLVGVKDDLIGFKLDNNALVTIPLGNSTEHSNARKTKDENDQISGFVYEVTGEVLAKIDRLKGPKFKRVEETTVSGVKVWVYIVRK